MNRHAAAFHVLTACLTPLREDLSVDHAGLAAHCRWLFINGSEAIVLLGTTGEANSLSLEEREEVLDRLVESGIPPGKLFVGTGCCALPDSVTLTRHAIQHRVAGVLVLPPFYYKNITDEGLYAAMEALIQRVGDARLRLYLYHFPQMSAVPFTDAVIARLLQHYPGVVAGMKDSSGDWAHMQHIRKAFPDFQLYAGSERFLLDILKIGGAGAISATTNVNIAMAAQVYQRRDDEAAVALQAALTRVRCCIEQFPVIAALKEILAGSHHRPSWRHVRPPLVPLRHEARQALWKELEALQFTPPAFSS